MRNVYTVVSSIVARTIKRVALSAAEMTMLQVLLVVVVVISGGLVAAGKNETRCAPQCTCRRKSPSSAFAMDCSGDGGRYPLAHLNMVNVSSSVSDLDLSNSSLTSLSSSSLRGFSRLQTLSVRWSRLAIVDSGAFRGTQLRRLDLRGNRLTAIRPRSFVGVQMTLVELDLSWNKITAIDDAFVDLASLSRLNLCHNLLASLSARSFRGLTSLRHLRLDDNLIAEVDRLSFSTLSQLTNLVLRGNPLSSLTTLHFADNVPLSYLDLSECSLLMVPRGVPDTVTYLQLRRNNITRLSYDDFIGASK